MLALIIFREWRSRYARTGRCPKAFAPAGQAVNCNLQFLNTKRAVKNGSFELDVFKVFICRRCPPKAPFLNHFLI